MSEQWLKDIADRMSEFEVDEPQGLWQAVESRRSQVRAAVWWRRVAVAAAVAAAVGVGIYFAVRESAGLPQQPSVAEVAKPQTKPEAGPPAAAQVPQPQPAVAEPMPVLQASTAPDAAIAQAVSDAIAQEQIGEADTVAPEEPVRHTLPPVEVAQSASQTAPAATPRYDSDADSRCQLALFTTGGTGASLSRSISTMSVAAAGPLEGGRWDGDPYTGILVYNNGTETVRDIDHHLPVRFGLAFAMPLTERLSIGSGLTYTHLTSDTFEGSTHSYVDGRQTLHYIGVPINLSYNVLTIGQLGVYASGGAMVEKAVHGRIRQSFILNGTEYSTTTAHAPLPWQFSLNLGVGLQYRISPTLGIYTEPGLSYYLPDNSSLRTIYSDKPLNFSLNLGLRFTLQR